MIKLLIYSINRLNTFEELVIEQAYDIWNVAAKIGIIGHIFQNLNMITGTTCCSLVQ